MYSLWIRSYNDLPFKRYQSRITVFRNEMQTRPFMRGREFMFFETHDVFATHEDAMGQIKKDMQMMHDVVENKLFIPFIFLKRPQWDRFLGAEDTYASDTLHPDGRRSQISSTHDLGENFAKAFNILFTDKDGRQKHAHQTCFGPGIWRIIAALISIHGDDKGLVLPWDVAPVQAVIVPITFGDDKKVFTYAEQVKKELQKEGYRVAVDASPMTPGEKYNIWEMKGVPIRIEVGPREVDSKNVTLVRRTDRKKETVALKNLDKDILKHVLQVDAQIKDRALQYFKNNTTDADTLQELKKMVEKHRGFVKAPFCTTKLAGKSCADKIKEETTAIVCGTPLLEEKPKGKKCCVCKKPAEHIVYIAKSI
jgi:prolyl-tRNA synthetase